MAEIFLPFVKLLERPVFASSLGSCLTGGLCMLSNTLEIFVEDYCRVNTVCVSEADVRHALLL